MSNCVSCGKYAAEGNWICVNCHTKANKSYADLEQDLKAAHEEIGRLKARLERAELSFTLAVGTMRYQFAGHSLIKEGYENMVTVFGEINRIGDEEIYEFFEKAAEARLKELKGGVKNERD